MERQDLYYTRSLSAKPDPCCVARDVTNKSTKTLLITVLKRRPVYPWKKTSLCRTKRRLPHCATGALGCTTFARFTSENLGVTSSLRKILDESLYFNGVFAEAAGSREKHF